jgi:hypothetical protein
LVSVNWYVRVFLPVYGSTVLPKYLLVMFSPVWVAFAAGCAVAAGAATAAAPRAAAAAATITTPALLLPRQSVIFVRMEGFPSLGYAFAGSE